jgi:YD repeat-containing protein
MGRLAKLTQPNGLVIEYTYDAKGRKTSIIANGRTISYSYDAIDRLTAVSDDHGTTRYAYDPLGRQTRIDYPNGTVTTTDYDALGRPILVESQDAQGNPIARTHYSLDAAGHRTRLSEPNRTLDYAYDALYRLTQETLTDAQGTRTTTWSYDKVGNRLSQTLLSSPPGEEEEYTTYSYDDNDRLLTATTNGQITAYSYDDNGNTLTKSDPQEGQTTYTWNPDGRLIGAVTPTDTLAFQYDADGIRTARSENGQTTHYLIDPNQAYAQVLGEYQGGQEQVRYSYGNDLLSQVRPDAGVRYYHTDALGSTRALSNAAGQGTDAYGYKAFGELDAGAGNSENDYLFTGEQFDGGVGLYYLRARY